MIHGYISSSGLNSFLIVQNFANSAHPTEKGSYRLPQMLETIKKLPNRATPYNKQSGQNFALYVLDDYTVHCMPEVRQALLKRGYFLVVIGGGITGDCQVMNFCHSFQKIS